MAFFPSGSQEEKVKFVQDTLLKLGNELSNRARSDFENAISAQDWNTFNRVYEAQRKNFQGAINLAQQRVNTGTVNLKNLTDTADQKILGSGEVASQRGRLAAVTDELDKYNQMFGLNNKAQDLVRTKSGYITKSESMAKKQGNQGKMGEGVKINPTTFEIYGANSGTVFGKGATLAEANALATQMQSGGTPTVSGRPDLFAVAPTEKTGSFYDKTLQKTVTPTTATPEQLAAASAGTLESYAKAQGLTYLDGPTFSSLAGKVTSNDLIDIDGRLFLKSGVSLDEVKSRKPSSTTGAPTSEVSPSQGSATPEDLLNSSLSNPVTNSDLQALLDKNTAAQNEYLATLGASADETAIKTQLADLRAQADEYQQSLQAGLDQISDETIPMAFITGQQASLERRAQRTIANYAALEKNLLERLGIEQEDRKMNQEAAAQKYEFAQGNIDLYFKVQDRIQAEEDRIAEKAAKLKEEARNTLADMLDMFKGYDMADLSTEAQGQLSTLATSAGIPIALLSEGMTSMKNSAIADALKPASLTDIADQISSFMDDGYSFEEAQRMTSQIFGSSSSPELPTQVAQMAVGSERTIDGVTYKTLYKGSFTSGTETVGGNVTYWQYDPTTGKVLTRDLGPAPTDKYEDKTSSEGVLYRQYSDGTEKIIFDPEQFNGGVSSGGILDLFPDGSNGGQCGAWVNDLKGTNFGDSSADKMSKTDPNITAENAVVGDIFVQDASKTGVWTGHVGIINGKFEKNGEIWFTVSESNWKGDERVTNTRQVPASKISGYARADFIDPSFNFNSPGASTSSSSSSNFSDSVVSFGKRYIFAATEAERNSILSQAKAAGVSTRDIVSYAVASKDSLPEGVIYNPTTGLLAELPSAQATDISDNMNTVSQIQSLFDKYVKGGNTFIGGGTGLLQGNLPNAFVGASTEDIRNTISQIELKIRNENFGASLTPSEKEAAKAAIPSASSGDKKNVELLRKLALSLITGTANYVRQRGLSVAGYNVAVKNKETGEVIEIPIDMFNPNDFELAL